MVFVAEIAGMQAVSSLRGEMEESSEGWKCRICLTRDVDAVMSPCGHLMCWPCASSATAQRPACPFCRKNGRATRVYR